MGHESESIPTVLRRGHEASEGTCLKMCVLIWVVFREQPEAEKGNPGELKKPVRSGFATHISEHAEEYDSTHGGILVARAPKELQQVQRYTPPAPPECQSRILFCIHTEHGRTAVKSSQVCTETLDN